MLLRGDGTLPRPSADRVREVRAPREEEPRRRAPSERELVDLRGSSGCAQEETPALGVLPPDADKSDMRDNPRIIEVVAVVHRL